MDPDNGAANLVNAEVGAPPGGNNFVEQVFSSPSIWKKIGSYLNMIDLLNCRLVNSGFRVMVMNETNFLDRCLVSLKPNQITRNIIGSTSEPWRNVELVFGNPGGEGSTCDFRIDQDELEWLYPIVSNVESLKLRMQLGTKGGDFYPVLKRLLNAPRKLRSLAIEPRFLRERATDTEDWKDAFEDLEEFEVLEPPPGWQNDFEDWKTDACGEEWVFLAAFSNSMKKIRILKRYFRTFCSPDGPFAFENVLLPIWFSRITFANTSTLKHGMFPGMNIVHDESPKEYLGFLSFPLLESATFYLTGQTFPNMPIPPERIREYLLELPMLKELDFSVLDTLPSPILNTIWERSDQLRILKIGSRNFEGTNWQFLKNTKIEELELSLFSLWDPLATLPDEALTCLPSTIKRLRLMGRLGSNPIPALARLKPSLLTELAFIDSGDCFTDDTIRYIRENFKMLRILVVNNVKRVSDAGFVASAESGNLSGIKGMKFLSLSECGSITDATLREIRFLELSHLEVSDNEGVTKEGWKEMLPNNPSLLAELKRSGQENM